MTTKRMGFEGVTWFVGKVEDLNDPQQIGRVRVRIHNLHDVNEVSANDLPWAFVMSPIQSASANGIGHSPTGLTNCSSVVGFFIDGNERNMPLVIGTWHGIIPQQNSAQSNTSNSAGSSPNPSANSKYKTDVHPLAQGNNLIVNSPIGPEPNSAYNAKYPHNKTITTVSGHAIEIDDTPDHERIRIWHKAGSYIEIANTGRFVYKANSDSFDITAGNKQIYVKGWCNIVAEGQVNIVSNTSQINIIAKGDVDVTANGNVNVKASKINLN